MCFSKKINYFPHLVCILDGHDVPAGVRQLDDGGLVISKTSCSSSNFKKC